MKILFVTTTGTRIEYEHYFTREVMTGLINKKLNIAVLSLLYSNKDEILVEKAKHKQIDNYRVIIGHKMPIEQITRILKEQYALIKPTVIHLNGYHISEIDAALELKIPVVITVHEGGILCLAGRGFLNWKDEICNLPASQENCYKCCIRTFPAWRVCYLIFNSIPLEMRKRLGTYALKKNFVPVISPAFMYSAWIEEKKDFIEKLKSLSAIIVASIRWKQAFERNGIKNNLVLIPHGIPKIKQQPLPPIKGKIKFFYLGRVEYSKGIHVMIEAFRGLDHQKYELHIIGDQPPESRKIIRYNKYVYKQSKGLNIFWHGRIEHGKIEEMIAQFHVMIHPTICLEVFGIAIAESLSVGRPVLATRCGGAEMQIKDGYNGWLVNPNSSDEMAGKINEIINKPEMLNQYSNNCYVPAFDEYLSKLTSVYKSFINHEDIENKK